MDSKIIESYQCSLEKSNTVSINIYLITAKDLALFRQTQIRRSTRHKNLQKQDNEDLLYSCLMLGYISPTTNFLSPRTS